MSTASPEGPVPASPYEGVVAHPTSPDPAAKGKPLPDLVNPPREVPALVRASNLLGGFHNQFAWAWLGLSGLFLWFFLPNADVAGLYYFRGNLGTVTGVVVASRETAFSENDVRVYAHTYRFTGGDGAKREGVSYATGRRLDAGDGVTVEYVRGDATISRIRGMRREPFSAEGWGGGLMLGVPSVFMVFGTVMLATGLRKGAVANRLLGSGLLALGRMKAKRATGTRINDRLVYEFTFEFAAADGRTYETKARTHKAARLSDTGGEHLLYDAVEPSRAVMLDSLPGAVRVGEFGQLETDHPGRAAAAVVLPSVVIAGHAIAAWVVLG